MREVCYTIHHFVDDDFKRRSVGPAPAIVRALPPIPDFFTLLPVTPIVLDLTSDSMLYKTQSPKFLQVPLVTQSKQTSEVHPWQPLQ